MDQDHARELLAQERARLERALGETARPSGDGEELTTMDQHVADQGTDTFQDEMDQGIREDLQREMEALERAEARVQDGTYGVSIDSGEAIPDARLEAQPTAERTVAEQERFERSPGPMPTQDYGQRPTQR